MEDPKLAKKLVKRELTRVVTPGTAMDANLLRSHENNYLAAVAPAGARAGVAHVDVSTGEFRVTEMDAAEVAGALEQLARERGAVSRRPDAGGRRARASFRADRDRRMGFQRGLRGPHAARPLSSCCRWMAAGWAGKPAAVGAAGAILHYLRETQRAALDHLDRPTWYDRADSMVLDAVTVRNLELTEPVFAADAGAAGGAGQATMLAVLDQTRTGMGGRLLRQRLLRPSMDAGEIEARLDAVGELLEQTIARAELREQLGGVLDIERLLAKVTLGTAGPREMLALGRSIEKIPALRRLIRDAAERAPARHSRWAGRVGGRGQAGAGGDRRRAAPQRGRWRGDPRRLPRGARRTARPEQNGQRYIAQIESAGAAAHRHRVAQGAVQQCVRILHRNHARQPAPGAGGLRAQADAGQRRAIHHPGAERIRT